MPTYQNDAEADLRDPESARRIARSNALAAYQNDAEADLRDPESARRIARANYAYQQPDSLGAPAGPSVQERPAAYSGMPPRQPAAPAAPAPDAAPEGKPVPLTPSPTPPPPPPAEGVADLVTKSRYYADKPTLQESFAGLPTSPTRGVTVPPRSINVTGATGEEHPFTIPGFSTEVKLPSIYDPESRSSIDAPSAFTTPARVDPSLVRDTMRRVNEIGLLRQGFARNPTGWELRQGTPNKPQVSDAWQYPMHAAEEKLSLAKDDADYQNKVRDLLNKVAGEGFQAQLAGVKSGVPIAKAQAGVANEAAKAGLKVEEGGANRAARASLESSRNAVKVHLQKMKLDPGELSPQAMDMLADLNAKYGLLPSIPASAGGGTIKRRVLEHTAKQLAGQNPTMMRANMKADTGTLGELRKRAAALAAFESTALSNLERAVAAIDKLPDTGSPWLNKPIREVMRVGFGSPDVTAAHTVMLGAMSEVAKIIASPGLSSILTNEARQAAERLLDKGSTPAQARAVARMLRQEVSARTAGLDQEISAAQKRIAAPLPGKAPQASPAQNALPQEKLSHAVDPTGSLAAKLKDGHRVFIVKGTPYAAKPGQALPASAEKEIIQ